MSEQQGERAETVVEVETTGNAVLYAALAKAQGAIESIPKSKTATVKTKSGASYTYKYASLADIIAGIRGPLSANGLAIIQRVNYGPDDAAPMLITRLGHSSGQFEECQMPLIAHSDPQVFGSYLSYMRKYALSSLINVSPDEDDDGQAARDAAASGNQSNDNRQSYDGAPWGGQAGQQKSPSPQSAPERKAPDRPKRTPEETKADFVKAARELSIDLPEETVKGILKGFDFSEFSEVEVGETETMSKIIDSLTGELDAVRAGI